MAYPELTKSTLDPQLVSILQQLASDITVLQQNVTDLQLQLPTEFTKDTWSSRDELDNTKGFRMFLISWASTFPDVHPEASDSIVIQFYTNQETLQIGTWYDEGLVIRTNDLDAHQENWKDGWTAWKVINFDKVTTPSS